MANKKRYLGRFTVIAALSVAVLAAGCGDKTTQQYAEQQAGIEAAQENGVAGTYNGTLTALTDGATLGEIQITLTPGSVPVPSPDGTATTSQANINVSVSIIGTETSEASFTGGYEPDTGQVVGVITISDETINGQTVTMDFNGTVKGSSLNGSIKSNQFSGDGGNFTTILNGATTGAQGSSVGQTPVNHMDSYAEAGGAASECNNAGTPCTATMTVNDSPSSSTDAFADTLIPNVSAVNIVVEITTIDPRYGEAAPSKYYFGGSSTNTAEEDDRLGTLTGSGPGPEGEGTDSLNCTGSKTSGWSCSLDGASFRVAPSALSAK